MDITRTESQDAYAVALAAAMGFMSCPTDTTEARRWITNVSHRLQADYGYDRQPEHLFAKVLDALEGCGFLAHLRECRDGLGERALRGDATRRRHLRR